MENSRIVWVHHRSVLRSFTNETFGLREGNIGGGCPVAVVVGDDLNAIILPDIDTNVWDDINICENGMSEAVDLRVGSAKIDTDGSAEHHFRVGFRGGLGRISVVGLCSATAVGYSSSKRYHPYSS